MAEYKFLSRRGVIGSLVAAGLAAAGFYATRTGAQQAPAAAPAPIESSTTEPQTRVASNAPVQVAGAPPEVRTDYNERDSQVRDGFVADFREMVGRYTPGSKFSYVLPPGADKVFNLYYTDANRPIKLYNGDVETPSPYSVALTVKGRHAAEAGHGHEGIGWHKFKMDVISPRGQQRQIDVYVQSSIAKGMAVREDGKAFVVGGAMISAKTLQRMGIHANHDIPDCAPGGRPSGRYVTFRAPRPEGYVAPAPRQQAPRSTAPKHRYQFVPTNICREQPNACGPQQQPQRGTVLRRKAGLMSSTALTAG
jgi:hypothetical protein